MKALIQRVIHASVTVDRKVVSQINKGLLVFIGIHKDDMQHDVDFIIKKILNMRLFDGENSFCDKSVQDVGGEILCVSQFTLYANCRKGNRPSFDKAMPPKEAKFFYDDFLTQLREQYSLVKDGVFGADMKVELLNDGPVTIMVESEKIEK